MVHSTLYFVAANIITNIGQGIVSLLPVVLIPVGLYMSTKWAFAARAGLGKLVGNLENKTAGLTNKARERAQQSNLYQRPQMAREFRKQERRRANVEDYASRITDEGWRGRRLRRSAAGMGNGAGQQRAYVAGLSQLEKQEHEEANQASEIMKYYGISNPGDLAALAAGGSVSTSRGNVSGAGNRAMQQAAMRKIIGAQDAEQLENLFMNRYQDASGAYVTGNVDTQMLKDEIGNGFTDAKAAGAHFVKMDARPYSQSEIDTLALKELGRLSATKMAAQDGASVQAAVRAFMTSTDPSITLDDRRKFYAKVQEIYSNAQNHNIPKEAAMAGTATAPGMNALFSFDPKTGTGTNLVPPP